MQTSELPAIMLEGKQALTPQDLGEIIEAFNEVTARLVKTHETLQAQVVQLKQELSEANEQVERSRRLAALGEMAAGISHEVRNPLGSILLYARMLQNDLSEQPGPKSIADKIAGAVQRLDAVVSDVLAFSREMRIRSSEIDACELIRGALESARGPGPEWRDVQVSLPSDTATLVGDSGLLQQALVNLIRNAVQAMQGDRETPGSGRAKHLSIELDRQSVRLDDGASVAMHVIRVLDTGPGLPPGAGERLCNPFYTTRQTGTGLGLSIVHRIVDAHHGRLVIRNREHAGAVVGAVVELMVPVG
jgi:signal transduction histidine kinase